MLMVCIRGICVSAVRIFRIVVLLILVLIFMAAVGIYVIPKVITPENLTSIISGKIYEITQMPAIIDRVTVVFFKGIGVKGLQIKDISNDLGKNLISSDQMIFNYKFFPLFKKQIILDEVTINNPRINLIKNKDGTWNFQRLFPKKTSRSNKVSGLDLYLNIKKMQINNAVVSVINLQKERKDVFYNVNLKIWDVKTDENFPYRIGFISKNEIAKKTFSLEVDLQGLANIADFNWEKASITKSSAEVGLFTKPINLNLSLNNFINPEFSISAEIPPIIYKDISIFIEKSIPISFPPSTWRAKGSFYDKINFKSFTGNIGEIKLNSKGQLKFLKNEIDYSFDIESNTFPLEPLGKYWSKMLEFVPGGKANFKASVTGSKKEILLKQLKVNAENARIVIGDFICSNLNFNAELNEGLKNITFQSANGMLKIGNQTFSDLKTDAQYLDNTILVKKLNGKYNGSKLKSKITIENLNSNKNRKISLIAHLGHLKIPTLFNTVTDFAKGISKKKPRPKKWRGQMAWLRNFKDKIPKFMPNFKGTILADRFTTSIISGSDLKLEYDLKGLLPKMEKLNGKIDATMGPGIIYQLELMAGKQKALDVAFKPFIAMHQMEQSGGFQKGILKNVGYKQVAGSFDFSNGTSAIRNFFVDGIKLSASVIGSVDWVGEILDIRVSTLFKGASSYGGLSENLTDSSGKPALYFAIKGTMSEPAVAMKPPRDVGKSIESAVKASVRSNFSKIKQLQD